MNLNELKQTGRNIMRLREIVKVLAKYGLAEWLSSGNFDWSRDLLKKHVSDELVNYSTEERIRRAIMELGPSFIKLGQIASTRSDIIGAELSQELANLQANVVPDSAEEVKNLITEELGESPEEIFAEFSPEALASASVAQVHCATLKSGESVVVKVQHIGIEHKIQDDLELVMFLAGIAEKHSSTLRNYQPIQTIESLRRTLLRELDFLRERRNLEEFRSNFEKDDNVTFPKTFKEHCTKRILVMERIDGFQVSDEKLIEKHDIDSSDLAERGAHVFLDMIFRDAFYHADPHPGNLMCKEDGQIAIIDCGMVGRISDNTRDDIESLIIAVVRRDSQRLSESIRSIGSIPSNFESDAFESEIADFFGDMVGQSVDEIDIAHAINRTTEIIRKYQIRLPTDLSLLLRMLVVLEGTGRGLSAQFNLTELLEPYCEKMIMRRYSMKSAIEKVKTTYWDWEKLAADLPKDLRELMKQLKDGSVEVRMEHQHLESTVNRLVMGVLTAALLVSSAMLWRSASPPSIGGVSIFGAAGFIVASVLFFQIVSGIRRDERKRKER